MPTAPRRLAAASTAAEQLAVDPKTIRRWISAGRLTGYRVGPRVLRVDLNEVEAMVRAVPTGGEA